MTQSISQTIILSFFLIGFTTGIAQANDPYWQGYDDAQNGYWQRGESEDYMDGYEHGQSAMAEETLNQHNPTPQPTETARKKSKKHKVVIQADRLGGYRVAGTINGKEVAFIIDTGATLVSLSKTSAEKLRLKYSKTKPIPMQTASGIDRSYLTTIKKIRVGDIVLRDVPAAISTHDFPRTPLLGMSFLGQLELSQKQGSLVLSTKR